ncbi:MAG: PIN domain-containing protein [Methylococcaceae bacterium]|nr:PIN domain-containing protein [Methylococcaceae bacterium]
MSHKYLLDASALLALLQDEAGSEIVAHYLPFCAISSVNLAEVASVLNKVGMPENEMDELFNEMDLDILPFNKELAIATGGIRRLTQKKGLSLGDRACLVTAKHSNRIALTADRVWLDYQKDIDLEIKLIR